MEASLPLGQADPTSDEQSTDRAADTVSLSYVSRVTLAGLGVVCRMFSGKPAGLTTLCGGAVITVSQVGKLRLREE